MIMENVNVEFLHLFNRCKSVDEIKEFIEVYKPNVHYVDESQNNAFIYCCSNNENIEILEYIIKDLKIDTHRRNKNGNNGLLSACKKNTNIDIIKYLVETLNMSLNSKNENNLTPFIIACMRNTNVEIIKYLSEKDTDVNHITATNVNGLLYACMRNQNPEVIKCLINDIGMNPEYLDLMGNNGFLLACSKNPNIEVIKTLLELGYDVHYQNLANMNGLIYASNSNNDGVFKYLMEETDLGINYLLTTNQVTSKFVEKINEMNHCFRHIYANPITEQNKMEIIRYLVDKDKTDYINRKRLKLQNIDQLKFEDLEEIISYINYEIPVTLEKKKKLWKQPYFQDILPSFTSEQPLDLEEDLDYLFKVTFKKKETIEYYGHKLVVYNMIPIFKSMINSGMKETNEGIHLHLDMNPRVFKEFLNICYTGEIEIEDWGIDDILNFMVLIDMYTHKIIEVKDLEPYLLDNIKEHNILKQMIKRYKMKYTLIALNNYRLSKI